MIAAFGVGVSLELTRDRAGGSPEKASNLSHGHFGLVPVANVLTVEGLQVLVLFHDWNDVLVD